MMLAKIETMKCEQQITEAFRDLAIEERNDARRWSAAWKRGAWKYYSIAKWWRSNGTTLGTSEGDVHIWLTIVHNLEDDREKAQDERDSAREVARRLLRERDEARADWNTAVRYEKQAQNTINQLRMNNADLKRERDEARDAVGTQTATIQHLESDRDALVAELAAQRNAQRKRIAVLTDFCTTIETERMQLRKALEQVEWVGKACPWCKGLNVYPGAGHSPKCPRQVALGLAK